MIETGAEGDAEMLQIAKEEAHELYDTIEET